MEKQVYKYISEKSNDPIIERKICEQSWKEFPIYESEKQFYENISPVFDGKRYNMPYPKISPEERFRRRLNFRHETKLYSRECNLTGKKIISAYSPDKPYKIYDHLKYWTDEWDPLDFGINYNSSISFFEQFDKLLHNVPRISLLTDLRNQNSSYVNQANLVKNCYMIWWWVNNEDCYYNYRIFDSKKCIDNSFVYKSEFLYGCVDANNCYNCNFCTKINDCDNSSFLLNCKWCKDCFMCSNLTEKQYYFRNKKYSQKEFEEIIIKYSLEDNENINKLEKEFKEMTKNALHKATNNIKSENVYGNLIHDSKNSIICFDGVNIEDCKYSSLLADAKSCCDISYARTTNQLIYESVTIWDESYKSAFCIDSWNLENCYYCDTCINSKNLFGCIGLNQKEYCIFNKQYSKQEYEKLVARIIDWMIKDLEWGEFFPIKISTLCYNETPANKYFPLSKEDTLSRWHKRSEYNSPTPKVQSILKTEDIPKNIKFVNEEILKYIIEGEEDKKPFRILKQELDFYKKKWLSIPTKHYDLRNYYRMKQRDKFSLNLWTCKKTWEQILSVYPENSDLKIYSEKSYDEEIYK